MTTDRTEPSAAMREMARILWETYAALVKEGFTEAQALTIVGQIIAGTMPKGE